MAQSMLISGMQRLVPRRILAHSADHMRQLQSIITAMSLPWRGMVTITCTMCPMAESPKILALLAELGRSGALSMITARSLDTLTSRKALAHSSISLQRYPPIQDLGTLGGSDSVANAIKQQRRGCGLVHPLPRATKMHSLWQQRDDGLGHPRRERKFGPGINNAGQVVGYSITGSGADHAFLYSTSSGMTDLNSLLDSSGSAGRSQLQSQSTIRARLSDREHSTAFRVDFCSRLRWPLGTALPTWCREHSDGINNLSQ